MINSKNKLDSYGIIQHDYGKSHNHAGMQYSPVVIAMYSMTAYNDFCKLGEKEASNVVIRHADWLVDHCDYSRGYASWNYNFTNVSYKLDKGWNSGLGNAMAIVALIQAHSLNRKSKYLKTIERALIGYHMQLSNGGFRVNMAKGGAFYEEYPDAIIPSHVLNGHLVVVLALDYYYQHSNDSTVLPLIQDGIEAVRHYMYDFDNKDTTLLTIL